MEYQKIINFLLKSRTKNWVEVNSDLLGAYNTNSQIKFKTSMLRSSLSDYSDAYILVKWTISIAAQAGENSNNANKKLVFNNCAPFTGCISKINNTQIDNAKHTGVIMPMYNLIEYSDNYSKSGSLQQYYRDEPALTDAGAVANYHAADSSALFKFKQKITGVTDDDGTKNVKIIVQLKYLSNFWKTLEMPLINCEINLILICLINVCYLMILKQQHLQ